MATRRFDTTEGDFQRKVVFAYTAAWGIVLASLGWMGVTGQKLPVDFPIPDKLGVLPAAVPWFGALGGVLISLVGIHEHRYDWDRRYWTWYAARPLVGAFVAIVAVLIFQSGVLAIGVDPEEAKTGAPQDLFYYVIAFATGYREDAFRTLLRKVVDMLFTSKDAAAPTITAVDPEEGPPGSKVTIKGTGLKPVEVVRFDGVDVVELNKGSDASILATVPEGVTVGPIEVSVATSEATITRTNFFKVTEPPTEPPPA